MFPNVYRHDAYWGAPRMGFCCDSPRMDFGFRPRPMYCGNPFASLMGGFMGGFMASSACGWGNSYSGYPSAGVSVFASPYSAYQSYNSFGYDGSAYALNDAYNRFIDSFFVPRSPAAYAQMPTSDWSMPFSSLTQSARPSYQAYSTVPSRATSQTSTPTSKAAPAATPDSGQASTETNSTITTPSPVASQPASPTAVTRPESEFAMDPAEFNAKYKGGDCGDKNDKLYFNPQKGEWEKSTGKGYTRQPIAPMSTLAPLPDDYKAPEDIKQNKLNTTIYLNKEALTHFIEMSDFAANEKAMGLKIMSGYRSYQDQKDEFEADKKRMQEAKADGNNPIPKAAPPGYSEHHTGFTFDIANVGFGDRDSWMAKNAKIFGFELSYPPDNKLGVLQESWHYRFNPELCEKYKAQREELIKKYIGDSSNVVNPDNIKDEPTKM